MMTTYKFHGYDIDYKPMHYCNTLMWFNIAKCARERMTEYCHDITRWRGERRSFYNALSKMNINTKNYQ